MKLINVSGGKNSTAMLLLMLKKDLITDEDVILYIDPTIDFEENKQFIKDLDRKIRKEYGFKITTIRSDKPFFWYVFNKPIVRGERKGEKGYGLPTCKRYRRWCCNVLKKKVTWKFINENGFEDVTQYIGFTVEESHRLQKLKESAKESFGIDTKAPLIEWGLTNKDTFELCKREWVLNPLYRYFNNFGCRFCPCYSIPQWRTLYIHFPKYFKQALKAEEKALRLYGTQLNSHYTLAELKERFEKELERKKTVQMKLF